MKNHRNMVQQKENDNSPKSNLKVMEVCNLTDREFKIAVMKKLNELQENSERQFNELRTKNNEQKKYLTKETGNLKYNQTNSGAEELNKQSEECNRKHWK